MRKLDLLFLFDYCTKSETESKFKIINTNVTDSMKNDALGTALMVRRVEL